MEASNGPSTSGNPDDTRNWSLILAGGDGTRLQDLTKLISGRPIPKQYCRIMDGESLLESTLRRVAPLAPSERTLAIVNHDHLDLAREQVAGLPAGNVLVQPLNRDTGPGLLFALLALQRRDPDATVAVFPSDHYVGNPGAFRNSVRRAQRIVAQQPQSIVLVGIEPEHPEPGYGYIEPGAPLSLRAVANAFAVAAFREKPSTDAAQAIIRRGGLWNSFVMVFRVSRVLELLAQVRPSEFLSLQSINTSAVATAYQRLAPWNFSSGFLTRISEHLVVLQAEDTGWSDWGTRESIERTFEQLRITPPWLRRGVGLAA